MLNTFEVYSPGAWNGRGVSAERAGRLVDAEAAYRRAEALAPASPAFANNLANALRKQGKIDDALAAHRRAVDLDAAYGPAANNLAAALWDAADAPAAVAADRRAAALLPDHPGVGSALLYNLHYHASPDPADLFAEHLRWAERHEDAAGPVRPHDNRPDPQKRLRVGLVSADLRRHPVATFQLAHLACHDREQIELICYSDAGRGDDVTARCRSLADGWRETVGFTDAALADLVRADGVDVLIDLAGHATGNRLLAVARRPAPVQATYNGYVDTTGMATMDWRVTDAWHDPPGKTDRYHTERLYRLPPGNWCYAPPADAPPVGELPALARGGQITFGHLNKAAKISEPTARLWAELLAAVPNSRLMVLIAGDERTNTHPRRHLEACGVPGDRLTCVPRTRVAAEYLSRFNEVDVSLDPFPFNGITTTCDSLWMGAPVVTLAGRHHAGRAGVSLLSAVGLEGLIARTPAEYVRKAADLALDVDRLRKIRSGLRDRVAASPLRDERGHAAAFDAAIRHMWRAWCRNETGAADGPR